MMMLVPAGPVVDSVIKDLLPLVGTRRYYNRWR